MEFSTRLIHNAGAIDKYAGGLSAPICQATTYDRRAFFQDGSEGEFDYSRSGNPTRKALEETIADLEGGKRGFAFSSGMAAVSSALGIFGAGDHIIVAEDIYGGSYRVINTFFKRWGLESTAIDASNAENIKSAIKPNTKAVFLETPSNPLLKITDLKAAFSIAKDAGIISIVDNTFMTPLLQRAIALGADIAVHSATKFLGGHSDTLAGLAVTASDDLGARIYAVQNGFGAVLSPFDSWLVLRGMKTLGARLERQQKTAAFLAENLALNKNVEAVYYPALKNHIGAEIHKSQALGGGAVLSFKAKSAEKAKNFLAKIKLAAAAVSLGGVETIASYPVKMSHAAIPPKERERLGIADSLVRISAGLEDERDLLLDFENALRD